MGEITDNFKSRQIKFRAWDRATQRMYGTFALLGETTCFDLLTQWVMEQPQGKGSLERLNDVEVMQFTSLKDKNGVEIYEGDIIESKREQLRGRVAYLAPGFEILDRADDLLGPSLRFYDLEVIGNIYENPDLMKSEALTEDKRANQETRP